MWPELLPLFSPTLFLFSSSLSQVVCRHFGASCVQSSVRRTSSFGWPVRTIGFLLQRQKPAASTASLSTLMPRRRWVEGRVWNVRNVEIYIFSVEVKVCKQLTKMMDWIWWYVKSEENYNERAFLTISFSSLGKLGRWDPGGTVECDWSSLCWHIQWGTAENLHFNGQRLLPKIPALCSLHGGH